MEPWKEADVGPDARAYFPERHTLASYLEAAESCRGCPLFKNATQAVFGVGRPGARLMLVGEQPGNDEDLAGRPFVGPAGRVLDEALAEVGIERADTYVTNVVKHFKWIAKGRRRLHQKPTMRESAACQPWLEAEIDLVGPRLIVCLGATAAQALLGPRFRVSRHDGGLAGTFRNVPVMATIHPASILRQPTPEARDRERARFLRDIGEAASLANSEAALKQMG
jgi:DNA polymerase